MQNGDRPDRLSIIWAMEKLGSRTDYKREFCARVRELRERKGWTQAQASQSLGVSEEAYRKYEVRTPLPHALLALFALNMGVSVEYLITGKESPRPPLGARRRPGRAVRSSHSRGPVVNHK